MGGLLNILATVTGGDLPLVGVHPAGVSTPPQAASRISIFEGYAGVLMAAFLVTLAATPILRRLAIANGVIDRPSDPRKVHKMPVAYLGGVAVYLGMMAGILFALFAIRFPALVEFHHTQWANDDGVRLPVPVSVLLGMTVIVTVGVLDDVMSISPREDRRAALRRRRARDRHRGRPAGRRHPAPDGQGRGHRERVAQRHRDHNVQHPAPRRGRPSRSISSTGSARP